MSLTLYRKYRPQFFKEVVDQNHIKITLTNELETGRIAHAYLFCGPRGIGKTTTARLLAKALNCEKRQKNKAEPCNQCHSCLAINEGRSLDLIEIDAASHTGVDNVRENIINNSRVSPVSSTYKVFIIDEVHMLSLSAFNALLKTLEEPPQHVIFILATTEVHKVPETIISRCQRFDFQKVGIKEIEERLDKLSKEEKIKVEPVVLKAIAQAAEGSVRDAESMLGQIFSLGEKEITKEMAALVIPHSDFKLVIELLSMVTRKDTASAIESINRLVEEGVNLRHFIKSIIEVIRKIILIKVSASLDEFSPIELDEEQEKEVSKIIIQVDVSELIRWLKIFLEKEQLLRTNLEIIQLPLEMAILEIIEPFKLSSTKKEEIKILPLKRIKEEKKEDKIAAKEGLKEYPKAEKPGLRLSDIKKNWSEFLSNLRKYNHSLVLTLRVSEIVSVVDNVITIGFGFRFYQDLVWKKKNKEIVEKVLKETYHQPLRFKCTILEELRNKTVEKLPKDVNLKVDNLREVIDTFGGEVVES